MKLPLIVTAFVVSCSSCSWPLKSDPIDGVIETLQSVQIDSGNIQFDVRSQGCTQPENFTLHTTSHRHGFDIVIYRTKPDRCRRRAFIKNIDVALPDNVAKSGLPIFIKNPLSSILASEKSLPD